MLPGTSLKNSNLGLPQRKFILYLTLLKVMGESPTGDSMISSWLFLSVFLTASGVLHPKALQSQDDHSSFSHIIKLQEKAVLLPCVPRLLAAVLSWFIRLPLTNSWQKDATTIIGLDQSDFACVTVGRRRRRQKDIRTLWVWGRKRAAGCGSNRLCAMGTFQSRGV